MNNNKTEEINNSKQLGDYITVASPGSWMIFVTALVLLLGIIIWSIFGEVESRIGTVIIADSKGIRCFVKAEDIDEINIGQKVSYSDGELIVSEINDEPIIVDEQLSEYVRWLGDITPGEYIYIVYLKGAVKSGIYDADITVKTMTPISLIYD